MTRRRRMRERTGPSGFTIHELLVVVATIALLASILFPSLSRARQLARKTACMSRLRQMGLALLSASRSTPTRERLKASHWLRVDLAGGSVTGGWLMDHEPATAELALCPADDAIRPDHSPLGPHVELSYLMNDDQGRFTLGIWSLRHIARPATTLAALEAHEELSPWDNTVAWKSLPNGELADLPTERHLGGGNLLMFDAHVTWTSLERYREEYPDWPRWNPR